MKIHEKSNKINKKRLIKYHWVKQCAKYNRYYSVEFGLSTVGSGKSF